MLEGYSLYILVGLGSFFVVWAIGTYNGLIRLRVAADNSWSDIEVQLKKRHNLIPNLVETVKGYAQHEAGTLEMVIEARNRAAAAENPDEQVEAENMLSGMLRQVFALSEAYPDLKANSNFADLQHKLSQIENDIADSRRYYNAVARDFNTKQLMFPNNIVARLFAFSQKTFFEAEQQAKATPQVEF